MKKWLRKLFDRVYNFLDKHADRSPANVVLWKANIKEKEKLTIDDAKFIFDQAEKLLNDSVVSSETIVSRMNTLITIITGSLIALIAYITTKVGKGCSFDYTLISPIVGVVYLYVIAIYSFKNNQPRDYLLPGSLPKDLFNPLFFDKSIPDKDRILRYYVSEIENYQTRIEINSEINSQRWNRYSDIVKLMVALPLILLLILLCFH